MKGEIVRIHSSIDPDRSISFSREGASLYIDAKEPYGYAGASFTAEEVRQLIAELTRLADEAESSK